jgi:hypothetical protein
MFYYIYKITNLVNKKIYIGVHQTKNLNDEYFGSGMLLNRAIKKYGKEFFSREIISLHKTKGYCNYEETKQLFLNNVLRESLDDGTPAFYNSNILGRYLRKDYGNFGKDSS